MQNVAPFSHLTSRDVLLRVALAIAVLVTGVFWGAVPATMLSVWALKPVHFLLGLSMRAMDPLWFGVYALAIAFCGIMALAHHAADHRVRMVAWAIPAAVLSFCCVLSFALRFA